MNAIFNDVRYALRQLRRTPGFAAAAVFTLALGIGACSAIFCLMDALWLHPMHIPQPGRIVRIFSTTPQDPSGFFSYPEYQLLEQRMPAFQGSDAGLVAIGGRGNLLARPDGTSTLLTTNVVSGNFFTVMRLQPFLGRLFTQHDAEQMRTHPGVVLSYECWQREFGGDPKIVGRQIPLRHGKDVTVQMDVWGVLPSSFRDIDPDSDRDLWMPVESWSGQSDLTNHAFRWFSLVGRLAPRATVAQATQQAATVAAALTAADPVNDRDRGARAVSDFANRMSQAGTSGLILFAIVCGVVLLAVVNVAQLLLARALGRAPEVALRLSLGAQRWAIARQLLLENLILGVLSLAAGLWLAAALAATLPSLLVQQPAMLAAIGGATRFLLDGRVFLFASLLALAVMLLLALVPLTQAARAELLPVLQAHSGLRTAGRTPRLRRAAIWLQIGVSFAVLVSTGALVRSFLNTRTQPLGITRGQVLLAWTQDPETEVRNQVVERLSAVPGVTQVAYAIRSPLSLSEWGIAIKVLLPAHPEIHDAIAIKFNAVSPNYLNVIGTGIVRGRGFVQSDEQGGTLNFIVSQAMAQKYWPGQNPIGQVVRVPWAKIDGHVVGVAENAVVNQVGEPPEPYIYVPFQQYVDHLSNMGEITFALATQQNAMSLAEDTRQALIGVNPLLDPMVVTSLPELIRYSSRTYQMMAELVTALGFIGLALTAVGLYGFLAFRVAQRRREIGIRMALGATREATVLLVFRDTMNMAIIGLALGLVLALVAARLESAVLFDVRPLDALTLVAALSILAVAVVGSAWLPAHRAASVEPMQALRSE
jgi:predicted permease